jgi:hypothetical protein
MKATYLVWTAAIVLSQVATCPQNGNAIEPAARAVTLDTADVLHERLNLKCNSVGAIALYRGALACEYGLGGGEKNGTGPI